MTNIIPISTASMVGEYAEMLSYARPANSRAEQKFIRRFLEPLGLGEDKAGNLIKRIGTSRVLWSSHTDTVHRVGGRQRVVMEGTTMKLAHKSTSNCLGADCTTGVWLMMEMIRAKVPGLYVFHRAEERGCVGSRWIAKTTPALLTGIDAAIAFDRKGTTSIITHQSGERCCSPDFADSLNAALGDGFRHDSGGSFTDTAEYVDHVGECTNLSVGYQAQHTSFETQDVAAMIALRSRLLAFDESKLVIKRKPGEREWSTFGWRSDLDLPMFEREEYEPQRYRATGIERLERLERLVRLNPEAVADFLEASGYTVADIEAHIYDVYGSIRTS